MTDAEDTNSRFPQSVEDTRSFNARSHPVSQRMVVLAFFVFLTGMVVAVFAWRDASKHAIAAEQQRFEHQTDKVVEALTHRLSTQDATLRSAAGFISARDNLGQTHWRRYFNAQAPSAHYEGRLMLGYAPRIHELERASHEAKTQNEGQSGYRLLASGKHEYYYPLLYVKPLSSTLNFTPGQDLQNDPAAAQGLAQAAKTGATVLAGPLTLDSDQAPNFQVWGLIVPVYASSQVPPTPEARELALLGYLIEAFSADDTIVSALNWDSPSIGLNVQDKGTKVYEHPLLKQQLAWGFDPPLRREVALNWQDRTWTLQFAALDGYINPSTYRTPALLLTAGMCISLLLAVLVGTLGTSRERALFMVRSRTEALKEALAEHEESETRLRAVFDNALDAIVTIDRAGQIENYNPAAQSIFGWAPSEVIGRNINMLMPQGKDHDQHQHYISDYLGGAQPKIIGVGRTVTGMRKDGRTFPVELGVSEMRIGNDIYFCGILRDITDRLRTEKALAAERSELESRVRERTLVLSRTNTALQEEIEERRRIEAELLKARELALQSAEAKADFLANMSHEIRTPMNAVIGYNALLAETVLNDEQQAFVDHIRASGNALLAVINDILDFSKIESGMLALEHTPFDLSRTIMDTMDIVGGRLQEKGVDLILNRGDHVANWLLGDDNRLRQVLLNLLSNAAKFTEKGQVVLCVDHVRSEHERTTLRFSVKDTGIGIAPEQMERLFKAFSQGDTSITRRYGGTGLGLVISSRLVRMMGGELRVDSSEGVGSDFHFTLSFQLTEPIATDVPDPSRSNLDPDLARRIPLRILVVEDNDINRELARTTLKKMGYDTDEAVHGAQAIDMLQSNRYDLMLMDLQMPVMDGLTAARHIVSNWSSTDRPYMVAMTANALSGDRERCIEAGMDDFLAKPVLPSQLQTLIRVLARRRGIANKSSEDPTTVVMGPTQADDDQLSQGGQRTKWHITAAPTPAPSSWLNLPVIQELQSLSSDDNPLFARLLSDLLTQAPEQLALAKHAANDAEWDVVKQHIHRLAGACANLGLQGLADACRQLESRLRNEPEQVTVAELAPIDEALTHTRQALQAEGLWAAT